MQHKLKIIVLLIQVFAGTFKRLTVTCIKLYVLSFFSIAKQMTN